MICRHQPHQVQAGKVRYLLYVLICSSNLSNCDPDWSCQAVSHQIVYLGRHGGSEQQRLAVWPHLSHDTAYLQMSSCAKQFSTLKADVDTKLTTGPVATNALCLLCKQPQGENMVRRRLSLRGRGPSELDARAHLRFKAHVKHAVCLIKHQVGHP